VPENHRHEAPGAQLDKLLLNRARQRHRRTGRAQCVRC
jgi:hypothetical protein